MAEPYTISPGYSGPVAYDPLVAAEPVVVDVFGKDTFQITEAPPQFPDSLRDPPIPFTFELTALMREWSLVRSDLKAGTYKWTYLSGALNTYVDPVPVLSWNQGFPGVYSGGSPLHGPTNRPWIRSGGNQTETFWFPAPAFDLPGYPTAELAESFSAGTNLVFEHEGGDLEIAYDYDDTLGPPQGSIVFEFVRVPIPPGDGFWAVVFSSLPDHVDWPVIPDDQSKKEQPILKNVKAGVHLVRFYRIGLDRRYTWQDYWIWVWKTPPRLGGSASVEFTPTSRDRLRRRRFADYGGTTEYLPWEISPVRGALAPGNKVSEPLLNRQYLIQPHPTAGNSIERPRTKGNLPKEPEQLGDGEAF